MDTLKRMIISRETKIAFVSTMVIGFITHMYILTNHYPTWDDLVSYSINPDYTFFGRPLVGFFGAFSTQYSMSAVNGMLALLFVSMAVILVVDLFEVKNSLSIILLGGIVVTFPSMASNFAYMYTADVFLFSFFLSILAIWLSSKYRFGFIPGSICIMLSLSIYQAYISSAAIIAMLVLIYNQITLKETNQIKYILKYVSTIILGFMLYKVFLDFVLEYKDISLHTTNGVNNLDNMSFKDMLFRIPDTYKVFINALLNDSSFSQNKIKLYSVLGLLLTAVILVIVMFVKQKQYKHIVAYLVVFGGMLVFPILCNPAFLISNDVSYDTLLSLPYAFILCIPVIVLDVFFRNSIYEAKIIKAIKYISISALLLTIYNNYLIDNVCYFNMEMRYEKALALTTRVLDRIETTEGYYKGMPICLYEVKCPEDEIDKNTSMTDIFVDDIGGTNGDVILCSASHYWYMMIQHLGCVTSGITAEKKASIEQTCAFQNMDVWPALSSVQIIDDVVVVKIYGNY